MNKPKALVVFSGGQDSTTCLYLALSLGYDIHTITFDYGQRHAVEINAAITILDKFAHIESSKQEFIMLGQDILKSTSPLVSNNELEQYDDHNSLPGGIEKTFVPMRNQLFLTIAANRAIAIGAEVIITGVCGEDSGGYPDCEAPFISLLEDTINQGTFGTRLNPTNGKALRIITPLMKMTKAESVELAETLPGCMEALAYSHTSYDGQYPPIGHDHATLLRAKGFEEAGVPDPLVLRAFHEGLMELPSTRNYARSAYFYATMDE